MFPASGFSGEPLGRPVGRSDRRGGYAGSRSVGFSLTEPRSRSMGRRGGEAAQVMTFEESPLRGKASLLASWSFPVVVDATGKLRAQGFWRSPRNCWTAILALSSPSFIKAAFALMNLHSEFPADPSHLCSRTFSSSLPPGPEAPPEERMPVMLAPRSVSSAWGHPFGSYGCGARSVPRLSARPTSVSPPRRRCLPLPVRPFLSESCSVSAGSPGVFPPAGSALIILPACVTLRCGVL